MPRQKIVLASFFSEQPAKKAKMEVAPKKEKELVQTHLTRFFMKKITYKHPEGEEIGAVGSLDAGDNGAEREFDSDGDEMFNHGNNVVNGIH